MPYDRGPTGLQTPPPTPSALASRPSIPGVHREKLDRLFACTGLVSGHQDLSHKRRTPLRKMKNTSKLPLFPTPLSESEDLAAMRVGVRIQSFTSFGI